MNTQSQPQPQPQSQSPAERRAVKQAALKNALQTWQSLCRNQRQLECTVLKLLRHSEATPESILDAAQRYRESYLRMVEGRATLREAVRRHGEYFHELQMDSTRISVTEGEK